MHLGSLEQRILSYKVTLENPSELSADRAKALSMELVQMQNEYDRLLTESEENGG